MTRVWPPGSGTGRTVQGRSDTCYSRIWWHWAGAAPPYYWSPPRWSGSAGSGEAVCKITVKNSQYPSNYLQSSFFFTSSMGQNLEESFFKSTGEAASKVIATPTTYMCISFLHYIPLCLLYFCFCGPWRIKKYLDTCRWSLTRKIYSLTILIMISYELKV